MWILKKTLFELYTLYNVSYRILYWLANTGITPCDFCLEWNKAIGNIVCWCCLDKTVNARTGVSSLTKIKTFMTLKKFCLTSFQKKNGKSVLKCWHVPLWYVWYDTDCFGLDFFQQPISFDFVVVVVFSMLHIKTKHGSNMQHWFHYSEGRSLLSEKLWHFSWNQKQSLQPKPSVPCSTPFTMLTFTCSFSNWGCLASNISLLAFLIKALPLLCITGSRTHSPLWNSVKLLWVVSLLASYFSLYLGYRRARNYSYY